MHCPSESLKGTQLPRSADCPHLYFHTIYGYCEMLTPPHAAWAGASLSFIQIWDEDAFSTARWQPCLPTQSGSTAEAKSSFVPNAALIFSSCWTPKLRGHAGHFKVIWLISENHNLFQFFFFFFLVRRAVSKALSSVVVDTIHWRQLGLCLGKNILYLYFIENGMVIIQSPEDGSLCYAALVEGEGGPNKALPFLHCLRNAQGVLPWDSGSREAALGILCSGCRTPELALTWFFLAERAVNVGNWRFAQPEANGLAKSVDPPEALAPRECLITS